MYNKQEKQYGLLILLFSAYLLLSPFYFFSSGLPQVADFFGAVLIGLFLLLCFLKSSVGLYQSNKLSLLILYLFWGYTTLVALVNAYVNGEESILFSVLFFSYNIMIFTFIVVYFSLRVNQLRLFLYVRVILVFCLLIQVVAAIAMSSSGIVGRATVFFNNPNQLGYFSVCMLSIYYLVTFIGGASVRFGEKLIGFAVASGCLYLAFLSLSKAAIVSILLLVFYRGWRSPFVWLLLPFFLLVGFSHVNEIELIVKVVDRVSDIGSGNDDSLGARGYDRIWNHPEYLVFGAGEGLTSRFVSQIGHYEIHSTWGTLMFSYGLIGFSLFCLFLYSLMRNAPVSVCIYLLPLFLYGLTHQGLRFTLFWVALGFASICSCKVSQLRNLSGEIFNKRRL